MNRYKQFFLLSLIKKPYTGMSTDELFVDIILKNTLLRIAWNKKEATLERPHSKTSVKIWCIGRISCGL